MRSPLLWTMILASLVGCSVGARILAMLPFLGKSHYIFSASVFKTLTEQGHQVVEYGPHPPSKPIPNHTHVEIHTSFEDVMKNWTHDDFAQITGFSEYKFNFGFFFMWASTYKVCEETFKHEKIQKLLSSNEHFDLIITESTFGQESMTVFGHKFGAPTVTVQGFNLWSGPNRDAGNALSIASIPDVASLIATDQMSFTERLLNFLIISIKTTAYYMYHLPKHEKLIKDNYRQDTPPLVDMVGNISLYFVNYHAGIQYPQPSTPNIIHIGGITISPERISLPQNIQKFMDEAKEGVIYFSFGTVVPIHLMPKEVLNTFVNVFKKLKQKVLWKIEIESIPGLSDNVMLTKWVPQPGVLAHPNCVLFITHGGVFSQHEAINAGVPTVGVPFFGDQPNNIRFNEDRGIGVKLAYKTISEETVYSALTTVLNNPKYKENAQKLARLFQDRPMSLADTVVYWVEYVLRHKGAHHLRPAATKLSWYQLALLDVVAVILSSLITLLVILFLIIRKIVSLVCSKKEKNVVTKNKKQN